MIDMGEVDVQVANIDIGEIIELNADLGMKLEKKLSGCDNMVETIRILRENASITYDLLDDTKATIIYKKIRLLADMLNACDDYATFHEFVKKLKPNDDYEIIELQVIKEYEGYEFFVKLSLFSSQDEDDHEADEIEAAG